MVDQCMRWRHWPVIAWLESRFLVTRLESSWEKWWLDSSHVFHRMTRPDSSHNEWLESSNFYKISETLMDKPSSFAHKETSIFASVIIKIGANFPFWLSSRAMLHFQDQVSPTCAEVDPRLCFHWGSTGHNILKPYCGLIQYLHIVIMAVGLILLLCVFSRYQ